MGNNTISEETLTEEMKTELASLANEQFVEVHHRLPNDTERKSLEFEIIKNFNDTFVAKEETLNQAFEVLKDVLPVVLTSPEWKQVKEEFANATQLDSNPQDSKTYQDYYKISNYTMGLIYKAAGGLYENQQFEQASVIFDFLTTLNPNVTQYWLGYGFSLKELQKFESALYCFAMTYLLDEKPVLARAESIDCYLEINSKEDAQLELDELEKLVKEHLELGEKWTPIIEEFKKLINKNN
jgi:tetratricopeptide (TPR) repeat protein